MVNNVVAKSGKAVYNYDSASIRLPRKKNMFIFSSRQQASRIDVESQL